MQVRCPHCHNTIELVDDTQFQLRACPSCGGHYDFLGETVSQGPDKQRTVGHFALLELVGVGHFGEVWMARDTQLDRTVAVKIPRSLSLTTHSAESFMREARAAAQLRHPHIVPVHEVGCDGDTIYIVSDFIRGVTLANYLSEHRFSPREAAALCLAVAEALHHAHEAGVVHRDLKPGNIMFDGERRPHLMDFGLAKRDAAEVTVTMAGKIVGTPAYMSPEQARGDGHQADRRSDIYSLGVTLYEMLTGERPFRGNVSMLIWHIQQDEPQKPRSLDNHIPTDLETICLKCLEKEPSKRYQTARDLADELRRWLAGEPILARPISRPQRAWRWCKRKPVVAGLSGAVAALILVVLAGGAASYWRISTQVRQITNQNNEITQNIQELSAKQKESDANLHRSLIEQAKALRETKAADRRWGAIDALTKAAAIDPTPEVRDELVRCLNLPGFRTSLEVALPKGPLHKFARFTSDGSTLLIAAANGCVAEYDAKTGKSLRTFDSTGEFDYLGNYNLTYGIALSQDGELLAANRSLNEKRMTELWSLQPQPKLRGCLRDHEGQLLSSNRLAFSQRGDRLAAAVQRDGTDWQILIYGTRDLTLLDHWRTTNVVNGLQFVADDRLLAANVTDERTSFVQLWQTDGWVECAPLPSEVRPNRTPGSVRPSYLSTALDGRLLAVVTDTGPVAVWDFGLETPASECRPKKLLTVDAHTGPVASAQISPDGRWLMTCGASDHVLKLWELRNGTMMAQEPLRTPCSDMRWSTDGALLAVCTELGPRVIEFVYPVTRTYPLVRLAEPTGDRALTVQSHPLSLHFDRTERWLACGGQVLVDLTNPQTPLCWLPASKDLYSAPVGVFAPESSDLWVGTSEEEGAVVTRWGIREQETSLNETLTKGGRDVRALVVDEQAQPLAAGLERSQDLVVWNAVNGKEILRRTPELKIRIPSNQQVMEYSVVPQERLRFSPDGVYLALVDGRSAADGIQGMPPTHDEYFVRVFDLRASKDLWRGPLNSPSPCLAVSTGARRVAVAQDDKILLIDPREDQTVAEFAAHSTAVKDLAFDRTGQLLASIPSQGRQVRLWATASHELLATLEIEGDGPLDRVALSPSAQWLVVADLGLNVTVCNLSLVREQLRAGGWSLAQPQ